MGKSGQLSLALNSQFRIQKSKEIVAFANWSDFYPNNETEKLFYIEVDLDKKEVHFNHKNHPNYENQVLRNASETAKRIKEIKEVLQSDSWAKYLNLDSFEAKKK